MNRTTALAKIYNVKAGAHPSLPDLQGFGRREMAIEPSELVSCLIYQVGALSGFLKLHGLHLNHIKPHGAIYNQSARSLPLAQAVVEVIKVFAPHQDEDIAFVGLAGTAHQAAAEEAGVKFIPDPHVTALNDTEWFADLDYTPEGKLIATRFVPSCDQLAGTELLQGNTRPFPWTVCEKG
ncbi:hypothetical protein H0H87_009294 [Tephrocybe sp. NHM501043]|nr:hypothetical protein H0H87_009294 [Tephrocybe sp. NHM501043]